jgi:dephospho-CoA kinase
MLVLGLTGSLGMGKSTAAAMFAKAGVPVFDADATVHRLYGGPATAAVEAAFPGTTGAAGVDRAKLGARVARDRAALERLEAIIHPLVREAEATFRAKAAGEGRRVVLLDIPLLFETGGRDRVDAVVLVSTTAAIQRERVLARAGMTEEKFQALSARQMPDAEKRLRSHFVIDTGGPFDATERQIRDVLLATAGMAGGR